jgi:low temperature requirement protein LtrA
MTIRFQIAAMVFMMVQAVMFGIGTILVLASPLANDAMRLMPWVVGISVLVSLPVSWIIAPRLRARFWNEPQSREPSLIAR